MDAPICCIPRTSRRACALCKGDRGAVPGSAAEDLFARYLRDANVCAAPPPEDGTLYVPHPNRGAKTCAADAYKSGLGDVDPSVYRYNVIRFVQTATGGYRLQVDETPIVAGASHLGNQRGRADDYFGDGMADIVADAGCPLLPTDNFPNNACELSAEGDYGPGSATSYLDSAQTIQLGQLVDPAAINLVINENLGDGARLGLAPTFPDLMTRAVNGLNDRAQWDYFPLSSSAGRTGTGFPVVYHRQRICRCTAFPVSVDDAGGLRARTLQRRVGRDVWVECVGCAQPAIRLYGRDVQQRRSRLPGFSRDQQRNNRWVGSHDPHTNDVPPEIPADESCGTCRSACAGGCRYQWPDLARDHVVAMQSE